MLLSDAIKKPRKTSAQTPRVQSAQVKQEAERFPKVRRGSSNAESQKPSADRICSHLTTGLAWIEPNGTVHWLDRKTTHGKWAYFYKRPERDDGTWEPVEDWATYNELIDAGWIRVSNILHLTVDELDTPPTAAWDAWARMMTDCRRSSDFSVEDSVVRISAGRMGMNGININPAEAVERFCSRKGKDAFWSSMMGVV